MSIMTLIHPRSAKRTAWCALLAAATVPSLVAAAPAIAVPSASHRVTSARTAAPTARTAVSTAPVRNAGVGPASAPLASDWPTYHRDGQRTGAVSVPLMHGLVQPIWNLKLDGAVYASPITAAGARIVVTENDTVYRIAGNRVVWQRHLGTPVHRSELPCGNVDPLGITGTPAYDVATSTVVVVAELTNPIRHVAVGLDPSTGAQRWFRNVDVPASVTGITPQAMQQRGALLVSGGRVYVPYGGLAGDCSSYRGSVVGVDLHRPTSAPLWHFTVPTSREAGVWTAPGPSYNPGGGLLIAVGNGATAGTGNYDYSDSVLKIAFQQIQDSFSPASWRTDNRDDLDLGSQGPAIVGNWVFIAGKSGTAYVLRRNRLGGIGGEASQMRLCTSFGGTAVVGNVVYVPCTDGLRAVRINSDGTMTPLWRAPSNISGSPVAAAGRIWSLDTGNGRLYPLQRATGAVLGYKTVGPVTRFATPMIVDSAVVVGTQNGVVAFHFQ